MITVLCISVIVMAAIEIYIGIRLELIAQSVDNIEKRLNRIETVCNNSSDIRKSEHILCKRIVAYYKDLLTEIACLVTKNNEDIKRLKGNYTVGDLLRFADTRWRVFGKVTLDDGRTRWDLFGENGNGYSIYTDSMPEDLEFLGHRDLSFD